MSNTENACLKSLSPVTISVLNGLQAVLGTNKGYSADNISAIWKYFCEQTGAEYPRFLAQKGNRISTSFVNGQLLLENFDHVLNFLSTSSGKKAMGIVKSLQEHKETILVDLKALSISWELTKSFWIEGMV